MLTVDDIKNLMQVFATKQDLEKFPTKEEFIQLKDEILDRMDAVYKEVLDMRREQSTHSQFHEDIEKRLNRIESIPSVAHQLRDK